MPLTVAFAGTPEFAIPSLDALVATGATIPLVYTRPDRGAGRGRKTQPSPVKKRALELGLRVRQPDSLTSERAFCAALNLDLLVVVAFGLIIPQRILSLPNHGCVNVHASLLPRWRGAAPIPRAIMAGDSMTGITLMQMDAGLDTGDVLCQTVEAIRDSDTAGSLHDRLAGLGAKMLREFVAQLERGPQPIHKPQNAAAATHAPKLCKTEARLNWANTARELERRVRAFNPWPVAYTHHNARTIRCWRADIIATHDYQSPGTVRAADADGLVVQTSKDALRVTILQRPGGKSLPAGEFLRGYPITPGEVLGL